MEHITEFLGISAAAAVCCLAAALFCSGIGNMNKFCYAAQPQLQVEQVMYEEAAHGHFR